MASRTHARRDPCTLSNYDDFITTHTVVNFNIDFAEEQLRGSVVLHLKAIAGREADVIVLDSSYLNINDVYLDGAAAKWGQENRTEPYGSPVRIQAGSIKPGKSVELKVQSYEARNG